MDKKLLFFGSDLLSKEVLVPLRNAFLKKDLLDLQVVSHFLLEKSTKKTNPIQNYCQETKLNLYQPIKSKNKEEIKFQWSEFHQKIINFDVGLVCSFGYMIPGYIIDKFPLGSRVLKGKKKNLLNKKKK